jgi:hypothetical protein
MAVSDKGVGVATMMMGVWVGPGSVADVGSWLQLATRGSISNSNRKYLAGLLFRFGLGVDMALLDMQIRLKSDRVILAQNKVL